MLESLQKDLLRIQSGKRVNFKRVALSLYKVFLSTDHPEDDPILNAFCPYAYQFWESLYQPQQTVKRIMRQNFFNYLCQYGKMPRYQDVFPQIDIDPFLFKKIAKIQGGFPYLFLLPARERNAATRDLIKSQSYPPFLNKIISIEQIHAVQEVLSGKRCARHQEFDFLLKGGAYVLLLINIIYRLSRHPDTNVGLWLKKLHLSIDSDLNAHLQRMAYTIAFFQGTNWHRSWYHEEFLPVKNNLSSGQKESKVFQYYAKRNYPFLLESSYKTVLNRIVTELPDNPKKAVQTDCLRFSALCTVALVGVFGEKIEYKKAHQCFAYPYSLRFFKNGEFQSVPVSSVSYVNTAAFTLLSESLGQSCITDERAEKSPLLNTSQRKALHQALKIPFDEHSFRHLLYQEFRKRLYSFYAPRPAFIDEGKNYQIKYKRERLRPAEGSTSITFLRI